GERRGGRRGSGSRPAAAPALDRGRPAGVPGRLRDGPGDPPAARGAATARRRPRPSPLAAVARTPGALDERERMHCAALAAAPEIGAMRHARLLEAFGSAAAAWAAPYGDLRAAGLEERAARALVEHRAEHAPEALWERVMKIGVSTITPRDGAYPLLLREIPDPPAVLYVRGELRPSDELSVAVVGTRGASAYGREMARRLAGDLARQGVVIVS